jgi:hypothetical protein
MGSGIGATTRFSGLLLGVAALGAVLVAVAADRFSHSAPQWGLGMSTARALAKRFATGDVSGAAQSLPVGMRDGAGEALRRAFDAGFGAAALTAGGVGVAVTALILTRILMPGPDPAERLTARMPIHPGGAGRVVAPRAACGEVRPILQSCGLDTRGNCREGGPRRPPRASPCRRPAGARSRAGVASRVRARAGDSGVAPQHRRVRGRRPGVARYRALRQRCHPHTPHRQVGPVRPAGAARLRDHAAVQPVPHQHPERQVPARDAGRGSAYPPAGFRAPAAIVPPGRRLLHRTHGEDALRPERGAAVPVVLPPLRLRRCPPSWIRPALGRSSSG